MLTKTIVLAGAAVAAFCAIMAPAQAQTVMQQCGQQYQAAKAGGTLNGQTWNQYRTECAARMKATPASTAPAPAAPAPAAPPPAAPPATTTAAAPASTPAAPSMTAGKAAKPVSAGRAAMLTRERQCGSEWRAQKVSLVAATPGLTWPKYWSQCNTRLKGAGQ